MPDMTPALTDEELAQLDAWWRACNYLAAGMIYLREPLAPEHIKRRLLGYWGSSPGLAFIYTHLNRAIVRHDLDAIFIAGPGHSAPGVLGLVWLEGTYGEIHPDKGEGEAGLREFFDSLFTVDRSIILNFHGYPALVRKLAYRRTNHARLHVRGYKEKGSIDTPLGLAIANEIDRFSLAIDVISRVPGLLVAGAHAKERLRDAQLQSRRHAEEDGTDAPEVADWRWPGAGASGDASPHERGGTPARS